MSLGKIGTFAAAASIAASGAFAQEQETDGRTNHIDTEYGLMEHNACKVGSIIGDNNLCLASGEDHSNNDDESVFTKDGQQVDLGYDDYLSSLSMGDFQYLRPTENSNSHALIKGETGERVEIQLREGDTIQEIHGEHILVRTKFRLEKVVDFNGSEVFSSDEAFMKGEEGFKKINIGELENEQFNMLVGIVAYQNNIRIVDTSELSFREASKIFYNITDKDNIIRLIWDNRETILAKSDYFSQYTRPLAFVKNNFDAIEAVMGRLEGKSLLEEDNVGYRQDFRSEYFEAFSQIPGLLEAFGFKATVSTVSNDSIFGESSGDAADNSNNEYQKFKLIRNVQFLYRRLENPVTEQMIEWFLGEMNFSSESQQESE